MQKLEYHDEFKSSIDQERNLFDTLSDTLQSYQLDSIENIENKWQYDEFSFSDYAEMNARYFFVRYLIYITSWVKNPSYANSNNSFDEIKNILKKFLNLDEYKINTLADVLSRLVSSIPTNQLKGGRSETSLRDFANQNNYKCYICGSNFDNPGNDSKKKLTLEHYIPSSLGGNKSTNNLFIACRACNDEKKNYLSWHELDLLPYNMMFLNHTKKDDLAELEAVSTEEEFNNLLQEKFEEKVNKKLVYAVSNMCEHLCSLCEKELDDFRISEVYIIKKDDALPCQIFNLMTICNNCLADVETSLPIIPKKRISNV